jgi:hypothetical protein
MNVSWDHRLANILHINQAEKREEEGQEEEIEPEEKQKSTVK